MSEPRPIKPKILRELLDYDPATGEFLWRVRGENQISQLRIRSSWNTRYAGKPALTAKNSDGYLAGTIMSCGFLAHRVAWAYHYGEWPLGEIDHINGDRTDNRLQNLRVVTKLENARNQKRASNNSTGVTGVQWRRDSNKWRAVITVAGRHKNLGSFNKKSDAIAARRAAEREFGYHKNHGRAC